MKMFDGDLQQAAVDIQYIVDPSYRELKIDWVKLDPGRLLQVLINLVTNAIKFTKTQELRSITITLSASTTPPTSSTIQYLDYADARTGKQELHDYHYEERDKSAVYIMITVADTGCGMKESTLRKLFHRWQQASPKTYTEYGGSGLGLFISKELARLQGGKIGVASEFGVGSTFAFYIDATRCSPLTLKRVRSSSHDSNRSDDEGRRAWKSTIQDKAEILMDRDVPPADVEAPPEVLHLLLVEDNLVNQKVMSKQLIRAGYKVTIANHGGEALEHIRKTASFTPNGLPLDTVLMDIEVGSRAPSSFFAALLTHPFPDAYHGWHRVHPTYPRNGGQRRTRRTRWHPCCDGQRQGGTAGCRRVRRDGCRRHQTFPHDGIVAGTEADATAPRLHAATGCQLVSGRGRHGTSADVVMRVALTSLSHLRQPVLYPRRRQSSAHSLPRQCINMADDGGRKTGDSAASASGVMLNLSRDLVKTRAGDHDTYRISDLQRIEERIAYALTLNGRAWRD